MNEVGCQSPMELITVVLKEGDREFRRRRSRSLNAPHDLRKHGPPWSLNAPIRFQSLVPRVLTPHMNGFTTDWSPQDNNGLIYQSPPPGVSCLVNRLNIHVVVSLRGLA